MNLWPPIAMLCLVIALSTAALSKAIDRAADKCGVAVPKNEQRVQPNKRVM